MMLLPQSPLWFQLLQKEEYEKFNRRGLPTRKEENWKYTSISFLPEFTFPDENSGDIKFTSPANAIISPIFSELHENEEVIKPYLKNEFSTELYPFATLNTATLSKGLFIKILKNTVDKKPISLSFSASIDKKMQSIRNIIIVEEGAEATIIEEYHSSAIGYLNNIVTDIYMAKNARINFYKIQDENKTARHVSNIFVHQKQNSYFDFFNLTVGAQLSREDITINQLESGAETYLSGVYHINQDAQHTDNHLYVNHMADQGISSMVYKGILEKKSRAVFNGKVHVKKGIKKISAYQANHNLLLSKEAEVNTKPELEIYSDDIKCAHGATVGQLNTELLYYLRSRGIEQETAKNMLLNGFMDEVINKIKLSDIRKRVQSRVGHYVEL